MAKTNLLKGTRAYLSGPMDFVASRADEKRRGWRNRVGEFLRKYQVTVFDPWNKPHVRGLHEYGKEGVETAAVRDTWSFKRSKAGVAARAKCCEQFWATMHIDLRMVDTSDFLIAYCPTNIYSVGTPHEIIVARQQCKPVLMVSPGVQFSALAKLRKHLEQDAAGLKLLDDLARQVPIKEDARGVPSLWYMPLLGAENFFDGFGFKYYAKKFKWDRIPLDDHEDRRSLDNPLLPFLERLSKELPKKWDSKLKKWVYNDDWLLWKLES